MDPDIILSYLAGRQQGIDHDEGLDDEDFLDENDEPEVVHDVNEDHENVLEEDVDEQEEVVDDALDVVSAEPQTKRVKARGIGKLLKAGSVADLSGRDLRRISLKSLTKRKDVTVLNLARNPLLELKRIKVGLSQLEELNLSETNPQVVSASLWTLVGLRVLQMEQCGLTRLPRLQTDHGLTKLILTNNEFVKLPDFLSHLSNLEFLDVSRNKIRSLSRSLISLSKLQFVNLSYNELQRLPDDIERLSALKHLYVMGNRQLRFLPWGAFTLNLKRWSFLGSGIMGFQYEDAIESDESPSAKFRALFSQYEQQIIDPQLQVKEYRNRFKALALDNGPKSVVIIGAGPVGVMCAFLLSHPALKLVGKKVVVSVYDVRESVASGLRKNILVLSENSLHLLRLWPALYRCLFETNSSEGVLLSDGRGVIRTDVLQLALFQICFDWGVLFRFNSRLTAVTSTHLTFASKNGAVEEIRVSGMDVVIACDGAQSSERGFLKLAEPNVVREYELNCPKMAGVVGFFARKTRRAEIQHIMPVQDVDDLRIRLLFNSSLIYVAVAAPNKDAEKISDQKRRDLFNRALKILVDKKLLPAELPRKSSKKVDISLFKVNITAGQKDTWTWVACGDAVAAPHFFTGSGVNTGFEMCEAALKFCFSPRTAEDWGLFQRDVLALANAMLQRAHAFCSDE